MSEKWDFLIGKYPDGSHVLELTETLTEGRGRKIRIGIGIPKDKIESPILIQLWDEPEGRFHGVGGITPTHLWDLFTKMEKELREEEDKNLILLPPSNQEAK